MARAFLKDPSVLLLDEATCHLDAAAAVSVQEAVGRLMRGRTCIMVTHDLSNAMMADQIIVLEQGEIVQHGSHKSLILAEGVYRDVFSLWTARGAGSVVASEWLSRPPAALAPARLGP